MRPHRTALWDVDGWVFFFIRDPLSRFESGFYGRLRQGRPKYRKPWTVAEAEAFSRFPTATALGEALSTDRHDQAVEALRSIEHVNSSYIDWFRSRDYLVSQQDRLFFIGQQEHMERDFAALCQKLDIDATLPTDPAMAHRRQHPIEPMSELAANNLRDWYAEDYVLYECLLDLAEEVNPR